jgi:hypothetical protein
VTELPDLTLRLDRIDDAVLRNLQAEINALGRPPAALQMSRAKVTRQLQAEWDAAHPGDAARRLELLERMKERTQELEARSVEGAMHKLATERVKRWAGETGALVIDSPTRTPSEAERVSSEWLKSDAWALVLFGGKGSSKSLSAARCARVTLINGGYVRWVRCAEAALERIWGPEADERLRLAKDADMLVLDDVGADNATDVWRSWLGAVIDERWRKQSRTIITSNLQRDLLAERLTERVVSRLAEATWCFSGHTDFRRQRRAS